MNEKGERERKERERKKERKERTSLSTLKLTKVVYCVRWLGKLIVSLKHSWRNTKQAETMERPGENRNRGLALRGALDFNSLTKLPKTHGCLSFSRVDLIPGTATIFIRPGPSRRSNTGASSSKRNWILCFKLASSHRVS